jgi:superfamily II DNA or RNA helicase
VTQPFRYPFEDTAGLVLHDYQRASVQVAEGLGVQYKQPRLCLYYRTGAGKTLTALACTLVMGHRDVLVIAPPTTHTLWQETGAKLGMTVDTWSHAKFRQPERKLAKDKALIVDEFHMLGGYRAQGFRKLERISDRLMAPVVIASATPNYNDVERCYCIQRIVDRKATAGGYLTFIYKHCATEVNPFGHVPRVKEFLRYPDAPSFLADMRHVEYIEDDLEYTIVDEPLVLPVRPHVLTYGLDHRRKRVFGSILERKHALLHHMLMDENGMLAQDVLDLLLREVMSAPTPVLVFAWHLEIGRAAVRSLLNAGYTAAMVDGKMPLAAKDEVIEEFRAGNLQALVGTQTLATGTDGLDKMCDVLFILDDTEDNAMRRQLIGRIMPRGHATTVAHTNRVVRVVPEPSPGP